MAAEALLLRQRQRVVDLAADTGAPEMIHDAVARPPPSRKRNDVLVVNVAPARQLARQDDALAEVGVREELRIGRGIAPASLGPSIEVRQLDVKDRRLQRVDPEVAADVAVVVLRPHPVDAEVDELLVHRLVLARHGAGIAERAEVLRREERKRGHRPEHAGAAAVVLRADRLRRILDHGQIVFRSDAVDLVHRRALAIEMHGHDRLRGRRDARLDLRRVEVVISEVDVGKDRRRAEAVDDAGRGEERVRGDDDLIAGTDAEDHEGDEQCVGAGRNADGVSAVAVGGEVALELIDALAEDERLRLIDLAGDTQHFVANRGVLQFQIEERDGHRGGVYRGCRVSRVGGRESEN